MTTIFSNLIATGTSIHVEYRGNQISISFDKENGNRIGSTYCAPHTKAGLMEQKQWIDMVLWLLGMTYEEALTIIEEEMHYEPKASS